MHMPFFQGTTVDDSLRAQPAADGFFHLFAEPQNPVYIIPMFNPHFIDLNQGVFQAYQTHIARVVIIIVAGTLGGAVIQEIGGLTAQAAQRGFKMGDAGLKRRQNRCRRHSLGFVKMGDVQRRIGNFIQNHGKIAIDVGCRSAAVVVRMFHIMRADRQPSFGELDRILQFRGAADGAAPDGTDGTTHFNTGIRAFLDASFGFFPVIGQGCAGIGKMMLFFGGYHHENPIRTHTFLFKGNGPIHSTFPDGNGGQADVFVVDPFFGAAAFEPVAS